MADDDIVGLENIRHAKAMENPTEMLRTGFQLIDGLSVSLFGFNPSGDPMKYQTFRPFSLTKQFYYLVGINRATLTERYDEDLWTHDDLDFWLKVLQKERRVLRFNAYHVKVRKKDVGGGIRYDAKDRVTQATDIIRKRYGRSFLKFTDGTVSGVRSPLKGI